MIYKEICHRSTRNIPATKFEALKGLDEEDVFKILKTLSKSTLNKEAWQRFAKACQEKQKKPKKVNSYPTCPRCFLDQCINN